MSNYGTLPYTGAGVGIFGLYADQLWLLALGLTLGIAGTTLIRLGFRRDKKIHQL